jgi:hypothetical protein
MGFIFFAVNLVFNFYREKHQTPNTKHQTPNTKQQTTNNKQQTPNIFLSSKRLRCALLILYNNKPNKN